jgi:hypothetical protein
MIERVLAARGKLKLQCELAYLRTLRTVAARDRDDEALSALCPQLAATGMDLQRRRDEDREGPMGRLAARFGLSDDEIELARRDGDHLGLCLHPAAAGGHAAVSVQHVIAARKDLWP